MVEFNINDLSDEEVKSFANDLVVVFEKIKKNLEDFDKTVKEKYGDVVHQISNLNFTPKSKILFLAKKIATNTLISKFTGIRPEFLNVDTSLISRKPKSYDYFLRQEVVPVHYQATKRLCYRTYDIIGILLSDDIPKIRDFLQKMDSWYVEVFDFYKEKYETGQDTRKFFGSSYSYMLYKVGIDNEEICNMTMSCGNRGMGVYPSFDFVKDIEEAYNNFKAKTHQKGRK